MATDEFLDSREEMEEILRACVWGCLGLCVDGRPYVVPVNYAYEDGEILFHCALAGKKLDCIRANPEVCFTVAVQPGAVRAHPAGRPCHVDSDSVICYGTARIVDDLAERTEVLNRFNRAFRPGAADLPPEQVAKCGAVVITIREMTGRREKNRDRTLWRHAFE